ncbi:MAG: hypothetical protein D6710_07925, partial [Nitrospirae bacterium]
MKGRIHAILTVLILILLFSGCKTSIHKPSTAGPIRIIYPEDEAQFSNDWVSVVASLSSELFDIGVFVDGKKPEKVKKDTSMVGKKVFYLKVPPGDHRISLVGSARDIEKVRALKKNFKGDFEQFEDALKK